MAMPDAVSALLTLAAARRDDLTRTAYNARAFNPSAGEIRELVVRAFPDAEITFRVDDKRQRIVDSWPADVNDEAARRDWGFSPRFDLAGAFDDYLIPSITRRYRGRTAAGDG
jgi:nucleoside-diphosphate-sugar epimerase